ncbi:hypothetical protein DFJ74DRAFT_658798 [Hyaloraphidium curvatum]|nr:hypothetical protein DFJ74DRAFT_658798 [Hyaloraphidium curvatum]
MGRSLPYVATAIFAKGCSSSAAPSCGGGPRGGRAQRAPAHPGEFDRLAFVVAGPRRLCRPRIAAAAIFLFDLGRALRRRVLPPGLPHGPAVDLQRKAFRHAAAGRGNCAGHGCLHSVGGPDFPRPARGRGAQVPLQRGTSSGRLPTCRPRPIPAARRIRRTARFRTWRFFAEIA